MISTALPNDISTSPARQQPPSASVSLLSLPRDVLRWQLMPHLSDEDILLCGLSCHVLYSVASACCKFTSIQKKAWGRKLACDALLHGQVALMHWALAFQMPLGDLCAAAARAGSLDDLKYAKERGALCDGRVAALAAKRGDVMMLKWLHDNGCVVDAQAECAAAEHGFWSALSLVRSWGVGKESGVDRRRQFFLNCEREDWKLDVLVDIIDAIDAVRVPYLQVFVNSVRKLSWLQDHLQRRDQLVTSFHEDMTSAERLAATRGIFAESSRGIPLVVLMTGVCAAQLLPSLSRELHIHYDLPQSEEALYSRSGPPDRFVRKVSIYFTTTDTVADFQPLMREFSMQELPANFVDDL